MSKVVGGVASVFCLAALKCYFSGTPNPDTTDLSGQVAIVTGGNAGIGRETALGLARQGCEVIICARDDAAGQ
jgi:hypothetical protein